MDHELEPSEEAVLAFMVANTKPKTGNFVSTWEAAADATGQTRKAVIEDVAALERLGLVERRGPNTWAVVASRAPVRAECSDLPSEEHSAPPTLPCRSDRSERTSLVKSSPEESDESLHSSESLERLKALAQEVSKTGRIARGEPAPETSIPRLVAWFKREVDDILLERGIAMAGSVPLGAAKGTIARWRDVEGFSLATIKSAMEKFLTNPNYGTNWVLVAKRDGKEPWWTFYNDRNVYLNRAQRVLSKSDNVDGRLSASSKWGVSDDDLAPVEDSDVVRPEDPGQE